MSLQCLHPDVNLYPDVPALNPQQRAAVEYRESPLLVLAGAGSGKTRVITHKIAHLIGQGGMQARHITAVTFTNKAAREMKSRLGKVLKRSAARGLTVSTFHTLGLNIIRRECALLGYSPGFSIYDAQDSRDLVANLLRRDCGTDSDVIERTRWRISEWKNDLVEPAEALTSCDGPGEQLAANVYAAYQRHLKAYNAVDFDDLILQPVKLFERNPDTLTQWQARIRYLLVDEYQDTNNAQYALVLLLARERGALTVVGDDDQSIYAWRGAQPENLVRLREDFPDLKLIKLEQNYRSSQRILRAANQLIANNPHVFEKRLWSALAPGDPITVMQCRDEEHEAQRVVSELLHLRHTRNVKLGDCAILYRSNHQARQFEKMLREHRLPYFLSGGMSFFERSEIKDLMAYLRVLANGDDNTAFLRIVNTPRRGIGLTTVETLARFSGEQEMSLLEASFAPELDELLAARTRNSLQTFTRWLVELGDRASRGDPVAVLRELLQEINYNQWLQDTSKEPAIADRRWENVEELVEWLQRLARDADGDASLGDLVAQLTLLDILERNDEKQDNDRMQLMTLHAAKGLEFPYVFMVGMEEALLPHRNNMEGPGLEEERRLAYVGITRAQRKLTLSMAARRRRYGETIDCEPSRFLEELPADDLEWKGREPTGEPERERGAAHLASLRALLGGQEKPEPVE